VLSQPDLIAVPKAAEPEHLRQNRAAFELALAPEDLADLDAASPPPTDKSPLAMI
jgi:diketogulonate reductase-like aldo/keto reductase